MTTDPMDCLEARARMERRIRRAVGPGAELWMTDGRMVVIANVAGTTQVVADVECRTGNSDAVICALQALAVLVGA